MSGLLEMALVVGAVFAASFFLGRFLTSVRRRPREGFVLEPNARLKLLTPSGAYRCHLESFDPSGIRISSPIHRDSYVPLSVGEMVVVQTPLDGALLTFRTEVLERDSRTHTMRLARPTTIRRTERRCEPRLRTVQGQPATLNGARAAMVDVSAWGARVLTAELVAPGETVEVVLPSGIGAVRGWVLEATSAAFGTRLGREVRIRFEDSLAGLVLQ
jgi:Flagellar protein YcgR